MAQSVKNINTGFAMLRVETSASCVVSSSTMTQPNTLNPSGIAGYGAGTTPLYMGSPQGCAPCLPPANGRLNSISDSRAFFSKYTAWNDLDRDLRDEFMDIKINAKIYNRTLERYLACKPNHTMRMQKHANVRFTTYFKHLSGSPLVLGFDTEWYEVDNKRILLSAQFSTTIDDIMYDFIFYTTKGLSLGSCLYYIVNTYFQGFGFCLSYKGRSHHKNPSFDSSKITLVGHFSGVDYSMFCDWDKIFDYTSPTQNVLGKIKDVEYQLHCLTCDDSDDDGTSAEKTKDILILMDRLKALKKDSRYATNVIVQNKHIVFSTSDRVLNYRIHNNLLCEFRLCLRDTMALSSPSSSLAELGESLGIPKLDTTAIDIAYGKPVNYFKSHMNELLSVDFKFFTAYALRDSRIAYEWYNAIVNEYGDGVTISAIGAREALILFPI